MVTRAQLLGLGIPPWGIDYRLRVGRLHRVHDCVYGVGLVPITAEALALAAVLASGRGALLSHRSAAALWGFLPEWRGVVEVTARNSHRLVGVRVHRSRTISAADKAIRCGIPVTSPARTLLDLADVLDDRRLARAVNEALVQRRLDRSELAAQLTRSPGRRGAGRLRPHVEHGSAPTRSQLEDRFLAFAAEHGLPRPEVNQRIAGYEVDMLWRRERLIVELDGRAFHAHRFERDRDKDAALLAAGFPVVRVTWRRLEDAPAREATRLRAILAAAPAPGPWRDESTSRR